MGRTSDRSDYDMMTRLRLLEKDADVLEKDVDTVEARAVEADKELSKGVKVDIETLAKELRGVQRTLIGILVSLCTAGILLALNIAVAR